MRKENVVTIIIIAKINTRVSRCSNVNVNRNFWCYQIQNLKIFNLALVFSST